MVINKRRSAQFIVSILFLGATTPALCGVQDTAETALAYVQSAHSLLFLVNAPGHIINWTFGKQIVPFIGSRTLYSGLGSVCTLFGSPPSLGDVAEWEKNAAETDKQDKEKDEQDREFNKGLRKFFLHPVCFGLSWLPYWGNPLLGVGKIGWKYSWNLLKKKDRGWGESLLGYAGFVGSSALVLARLYAQSSGASEKTASGVMPGANVASYASQNSFHFWH